MQNQTDVITAKDLGCKLVEYIEERYKASNSISGVKSGFPTIDTMTHGFQKGNLITVCSNLRYYKNCLVMQLLQRIVIKDKVPCGFISYTTNYQQFGLSLISRDSLVSVSKIVAGMLNEQESRDIQKSCSSIFDSHVVIPRVCASSFDELCNIIRESVKKHDLRIIFIDSLNTIPIEKESGSYKTRLASIIKKLKMLAVELDISIVTDYYSYENAREILLDEIDKSEILEQNTDFLYSYSDVVLQLQKISGKKGDDFYLFELGIFCGEYRLSRYKNLQFDPEIEEFQEEEKN